jgi:hypothetical protein
MSETSTGVEPYPTLIYLKDRPRQPVTLAACDRLEARGLHDLARIGRRYAIDRPRWFHRLRRPRRR